MNVCIEEENSFGVAEIAQCKEEEERESERERILGLA